MTIGTWIWPRRAWPLVPRMNELWREPELRWEAEKRSSLPSKDLPPKDDVQWFHRFEWHNGVTKVGG